MGTRNILTLAAFALAVLTPVASYASMVEATLIPDGSYLVKVEKIVDPTHITVALVHSGLESTLESTGSAHFDAIKVNDMLKVSIIKGKVPVYAEQ